MDPIVSRQCWKTLEPVHAFIYFAPEAQEEYAALGIEQVWVSPNADDPVASVSAMCERVLPRLAELS